MTYRSTAGGETTSAALLWWLLAMVAYPEVQNQAHAELDEVVGTARPPTFADIISLPYIRAMVKETLRWSPILPFGVPHASIADDWYEGMFIPKGTVCLQNMRVINSEEGFGSNAARFDPSRYLDERRPVRVFDGREEGHMAFGFGRRICPGRYVAEGTLAIDIATLLWAMRFERPEGARGELNVRTIVHDGITAYVFFGSLSLWVRADWQTQSSRTFRVQGDPSVCRGCRYATGCIEFVRVKGPLSVNMGWMCCYD